MTNNSILKAHPDAQGLIFDLDGTLIDSMPMHFAGWQTAFRMFDTEIEHDFFFSFAGKAAAEIATILIEHYHSRATVEQIVTFKQAYVYEHLADVDVIEPVVNVVNECYGKIPMAIGTGSDRRRAEIMLQNAGLLDKFVCVVGADDVKNHKPAPDTFLRCAELMGVDPTKCQVFEDAEPGLTAARTAGMIATDVKPYYM
ncbi:MAG: beta-phosphoglucomutase family hydrolase [Bacteroidales bacterium]|nr:beta-phosphoglucomutase family hydrolase [Bacteroidales bacterium]